MDNTSSVGSESLPAAFDSLTDPIFAFGETGTLLDWNRAATEVTGYGDEILVDLETEALFEIDVAHIRNAIDEQSAAMDEVAHTAEGLSKLSEDVDDLADRFRINISDSATIDEVNAD